MDRVIRVVVVDDSAYVRKVIKEMLSRSPFIEVVGTYEGVMNHVMSLRVRIRMFDNTLPEEDNRIDNVILAVPEPSSISLIGIGLLGWAKARRRSGR